MSEQEDPREVEELEEISLAEEVEAMEEELNNDPEPGSADVDVKQN